jgi:hypothetical protein
VLERGEIHTRAGACASVHAACVDAAASVKAHGMRHILLSAVFEGEDGAVSESWSCFVKPKHLELADPGLSWETQALPEGGIAADLRVERPALFVFADEAPGVAAWSDLFFPLFPGRPRRITARCAPGTESSQSARQMHFSSLADCS